MNPCTLSSTNHKTMITTMNRINRESLEVRDGIGSLNPQTQQLRVDLQSFMLELKRKNEAGKLIVSIEEIQNHEGNEISLNLPSYQVAEEEVAKEDEIEDKKEDHLVANQEEEMEGFVAEECGEEGEGVE